MLLKQKLVLVIIFYNGTFFFIKILIVFSTNTYFFSFQKDSLIAVIELLLLFKLYKLPCFVFYFCASVGVFVSFFTLCI
jgi:hypothetical protein